jgi:ABC-2 type transport system ATP-binding protein
MTVKLFLEYFIELKMNLEPSEQISKKQIAQIYADELKRIIETAKIENVKEQKIENLSKGYARRVGFAASLIGNPPILLLDEPTDGLDPNQKKHMRKLIADMSKDKTIIISTHLLDEAEAVATSIMLINNGKIVAQGDVKDILKKTKKKTLEEAFFALTNKGDNDE